MPLAYTRLIQLVVLSLGLLLVSPLAIGQDNTPTLPAPQFLVRDEDRLLLINGYTGEETTLPIQVTYGDRFEWSPDGQHLLAFVEGEPQRFDCINLFHVDTGKWVSDEPLACSVKRATFSGDGMQLLYIVNRRTNETWIGTLWLLNVKNQASEALYSTTTDEVYGTSSIDDVAWSPTEKYITFTPYTRITGGTLNFFGVMSLESRTYFVTEVGDAYYGSYYPIWSEDDHWMLMRQKDRNVTSGSQPFSNDQGDVYLVSPATGEKIRLTYTPTIFESDIHWTEDGSIAFTEVIEQDVTMTLEEAMNVAVVPPEAIIQPEEFVPQSYFDPSYNVLISPDPELAAWVVSSSFEEGVWDYQLNIGSVSSVGERASISLSISEDYQYRNILIGWRPMGSPSTTD